MVAGHAKRAAPVLFEFNSAVAAALCAVAVSADCAKAQGPNAGTASSRRNTRFVRIITFLFPAAYQYRLRSLFELLHMLEALLIFQANFVDHLRIHYRASFQGYGPGPGVSLGIIHRQRNLECSKIRPAD